MVQLSGPTSDDIQLYGDVFTAVVWEAVQRTLDTTANSLHGFVSPDDLSKIRKTWTDEVDDILTHLNTAYALGAGITRINQHGAVKKVLAKRAQTAGAGCGCPDTLVASSTTEGGPFHIPLVTNPAATEALANARNRLVNVGDDVWQAARTQLIEGLSKGEGMSSLKERVRQSGNFSGARAEVIARSEVSRAMNQGSLAQMSQLTSVQVVKQWLTVMDGRERPSHGEMDGEKVPIDQGFSIGEDPGDEPNCRCTIGYDIPDDACDLGLTAGGDCTGPSPEDQFVDQACPTAGQHFAADDEYKMTFDKAQAKIASAPVPSALAVEKARVELEKARLGLGRAGGESRGGSAASRRKQRENLFKEFNGEENGYVVCHGCGLKTHYADPGSPLNPHGYARFERGKIFVKAQGGGYQLPNLLPECFSCNRSRNDQILRPENVGPMKK